MNLYHIQRRHADAAVKCHCQLLPASFRAGSGAQFLLLASLILRFGSRGKGPEGRRYCLMLLVKYIFQQWQQLHWFTDPQATTEPIDLIRASSEEKWATF